MRTTSSLLALWIAATTLGVAAKEPGDIKAYLEAKPEGAVYAANGKRIGPVHEFRGDIYPRQARVLARVGGTLVYIWLEGGNYYDNDKLLSVADRGQVHYAEANCAGTAFIVDANALGVSPSLTQKSQGGALLTMFIGKASRERPNAYVLSSLVAGRCDNYASRRILDDAIPVVATVDLTALFPEPYELR